MSRMLDKTVSKWISFIVTTGLFGALWYIVEIYMPSNEIIIDNADKYTETTVGLILAFLPVVLSILWSILKKRYLWIWGVIALFVHQAFIAMVPTGAAPDLIPYLVYAAISYVSCVIAICMDRGDKFDLDFGSGGNDNNDPCPHGQCY